MAMKDSATLLNFNVNRYLQFTVFRAVDFKDAAGRFFNPNRALSFALNRDLGFGKRGIVFRGYVCPVCKAPVARDAAKCDDCGVAFKRQPEPNPSRTVARPPNADQKRASAPRATPPPQQVRETFQCPICGKILYVGVRACPGCNAMFASADSVPPLDGAEMVTCANCSGPIPPTDRYCRRCGSPRSLETIDDPSLERRM